MRVELRALLVVGAALLAPLAACSEEPADPGEAGAAGTGGGDPCAGLTGPEGFSCALAGRLCSAQPCCESEGVAATPRCRENLQGLLVMNLGFADAGGRSFVEAEAQGCLELFDAALDAFQCTGGFPDPGQLEVICPDLLAAAVHGTVAPAGPCELERDCALPGEGRVACIGSACRFFTTAASGESCAPGPGLEIACEEGSTCGSPSGLCEPRGDLGASCPFDEACLSTLRCDPARGVCSARPAEGEPCEDWLDCPGGLFCDESLTCQPPAQPGMPCIPLGGCTTSFCLNEVCTWGWVATICL